MRVILEVLSEVCLGHKIVLSREQTLEVGRSPLLDVVFEHDNMMSGRHCRIWTEDNGCYLEDLGSTNGTYVNGQRVSKALLHNNDLILAGTTELMVQIANIAEGTISASKTLEYPDKPTVYCVEYATECCASGLLRYYGSVDALPPSTLIQSFTQFMPHLLIMSLKVLSAAQRNELTNVEYLFDWLPESARAASSPAILWALDELKRVTGVESSWGHDALVAVFWDEKEDAPIAELRRAAGAFARPSVLRPQLRQASREYVQALMTSIKTIIVEGDSPNIWEIYSLTDIESLLERVGLKKGVPIPTAPVQK